MFAFRKPRLSGDTVAFGGSDGQPIEQFLSDFHRIDLRYYHALAARTFGSR